MRENLALLISILGFFISVSAAILTFVNRDVPFNTIVYSSQLDVTSSVMSKFSEAAGVARQHLALQSEMLSFLIEIQQRAAQVRTLTAVEQKNIDETGRDELTKLSTSMNTLQVTIYAYNEAAIKAELISPDSFKVNMRQYTYYLSELYREIANFSVFVTDFRKSMSSKFSSVANKQAELDGWSKSVQGLSGLLLNSANDIGPTSAKMSLYFNAGRYSIGHVPGPNLPIVPTVAGPTPYRIENGLASPD